MIDDVRGRISEGVNRSRLKLEAKRAVRPLVVVLGGLAIGAVIGAWLLSHVAPTLLKNTYEARFAVRDAYGVLPEVDKVRYRGIPAGTITKLQREGTQVVLTAEIDRKYGPLFRDVRAALRPQTPLNDMYLDIVDPGSEKAGKLDGIAAERQTDTSVKINDVLNTLETSERTRLAALLDNLGNGLEDGGRRLRAAVTQLTPFLESVAGVTDQLARRRTATKRLVHNVSVLTDELRRRDGHLRRLVRDGGATFGTLQAGSADLDATLRAIPGTFRELQTSFASVRGVLDDVDEAVTALDPVAEKLPASLASVRRLEPVLGDAVDDLQQPVQRLLPLTRALQPVADDLEGSLVALRPQAGSIEKIVNAVDGCLPGIRGFFQWNASLSKYGDARGPIPRGNLAIGVPDTGALATKREPGKSCAPGHAIGGRVPTPEDEG